MEILNVIFFVLLVKFLITVGAGHGGGVTKNDGPNSHGPNTGGIVGGVVVAAGVVLAVVINAAVGVIIYYKRTSNSKRKYKYYPHQNSGICHT